MQMLETRRFKLKPLDAGDEALYVGIYTDPALMRYVGEPKRLDEAKRSFGLLVESADSRQLCWVLLEKRAIGSPVGLIALIDHGGRSEIGIMVVADWQNSKVAQEAIEYLTGHAFAQLGRERVFTRHLVENEAGAGVMRRLGFRPMKEPPGGPRFKGWMMERDEWPARTETGSLDEAGR